MDAGTDIPVFNRIRLDSRLHFMPGVEGITDRVGDLMGDVQVGIPGVQVRGLDVCAGMLELKNSVTNPGLDAKSFPGCQSA